MLFELEAFKRVLLERTAFQHLFTFIPLYQFNDFKVVPS